MSKEEFIEFMKGIFELDAISLNLLESIYIYADTYNHSRYNWILDELLVNAFGNDITEEEMKRICTVEE